MEKQTENNIEQSQNIDIALIKQAQKRVNFKIHCWIYVLVNLFIWLLWYFIFKNTEEVATTHHDVFFKFAIFTSLAWMLILISHYLIVYKWNKTLVEKELSKLKKDIASKE